MSWFREAVGIDFVDFVIHLGVTLALMGFVDVTDGPEGLYPTLVAGSLLALGARRHYAMRRRGPRSLNSGEVQAERLTDLEARVSDLEAVQARLFELEERVDFAERLLTAEKNPGALPPAQGG
ncbi:MAG: hypothetical protein ACRENB_09425 [Gemmatimonadales bacterium]